MANFGKTSAKVLVATCGHLSSTVMIHFPHMSGLVTIAVRLTPWMLGPTALEHQEIPPSARNILNESRGDDSVGPVEIKAWDPMGAQADQ